MEQKCLELPFEPPNLPNFRPDETLYSWSGRVHRWNANVDVRLTSRQLFGHPSSGLLHDFPANLQYLTEITHSLLEHPRELAFQRTLLGYFLAFRDTEFASDVLHRVQNGSYPQLKYKLGIPASQIGGYHPLRFCEDCLKEDLDDRGETYWRLAHQFPSSFVCTEHHVPLKATRLQASPVHLRRWLFPDSPDIDFETPTFSEDQIRILVRLAELSNEIAHTTLGPFIPVKLSRTFRDRLKDLGLMSTHGSLRVTQLNTLLRDRFASLNTFSPFDKVLGSLDMSTGGFAATITRRSSKPSHPIKYLLLIELLFESWEDFAYTYTHTPALPAFDSDSKTESLHPAADPLVEQFLELIREQDLTITAAAKSIGISTTTGTQWAKAHGVKFISRPKRLKPELIEVVSDLLKSGLPKQEIVRSVGISLVSLNRLLAANADLLATWDEARLTLDRQRYRDAFLATAARHPGLPVKKLRTFPGNGYQWLYRHDKVWLQEHLPSLWQVPSTPNSEIS